MKSASILALVLLAAGCSSSSSTSPQDSGAAPVDAGKEAAAVTCTSARDQLLKPIAQVSTGAVTVIKTEGDVRTFYVDATAGGPTGASTKPRVYLNLDSGARVDIDDVSAETSTDWDLAFKRSVVFSNGGDAGPGAGGVGFVKKDFAAVSAADEAAAAVGVENFLNDDCEPQLDRINNPLTAFGEWYDYDTATNVLTPAARVYLVKSASGKLYKLQFLTFYANPDGSTGSTGGRFTLKVAPL